MDASGFESDTAACREHVAGGKCAGIARSPALC
jgi:hypothetical protein